MDTKQPHPNLITPIFKAHKTYKIKAGSYTAKELILLAKEVAKELGYKVTKS